MGWWIALAIVVGLAILPLGVSVKYNSDGIYLAVIAGPVRIKILPAKKKDKKPKKEKKPAESEAEPAPAQPLPEEPHSEPPVKQAPAEPSATSPAEKYPDLEKTPGKVKHAPAPAPEEETGGSWTDFLSLVPIVLDFLGDFRRKLRVNRLELKLILAADDPCDLALNYGRAWAALGNLMPRLERFLVIQKREVEVECDFTASQTLVIARLDLTITLGRILAAVFKFAFRALKEFLKIMNKRKGGAVK